MAGNALTVRTPGPEDVPALARVHVEGWRETYRGLMIDAVLDAPDFVLQRERFWTAVLTDPRNVGRRSALAEIGGEVAGLALAGPVHGGADGQEGGMELYALYLLAAHHGSGAGAALLDAVIAPDEPASLWVADPNPRAQAFYLKS